MKAVHATERSWFRIVRTGVRSRAARWSSPRLPGHHLLIALAVALAASVTPLWLVGTADTPVSAESVGRASTAPEPVVPGAGTAYLGAFVDPTGTALTPSEPNGGTASLQEELDSLPAFNAQAGGPPSILSTFQDWTQPVAGAGIQGVAATGAVPMVTWGCGDTDAHVTAGLDDATVSAEARSLAALDVPVLLRWFPDPNLSDASGTASCLGSDGASGYVAAYRHVHSLFEAAGATNVAFVWSVDTSSTADPGLGNYFPGGDSVDWIAADGYASSNGTTGLAPLSAEFGSWYSTFSTLGKPMMVSSTGADAGSQAAYLGQLHSDLPTRFPLIKALVYFDAPDMVTGNRYQLDAAGSATLRHLTASPYFNPGRAPTGTTVVTFQREVQEGSTVTLSASVDANDNSGSVSFVDNGTAIGGCVFIPIRTTPNCQTSQLVAGTQSIVAVYSGDTAFAPSSSEAVTVTVDPPSASGAVSGIVPGWATKESSHLTTSHGPAGRSLNVPQAEVPTAGSAYLGAFVDPSGTSLEVGNPTGGITSLSSELTALPAVEQSLGRPLSIVPVYLNWREPITATELDQVIATGGLPMITWNCGDTDSRVVAGRDDAQINAVATAVALVQAPVFLRWFPDPNVNTAASEACLGSRGAAGYVAAYQHIHDRMTAAGASNVTYVWSVDTTTPQSNSSWRSFYPGAQYVDWIGADGYATSTATASVAGDFGSWYAVFSSDKPLMISQTAAIPSLQAQYIQQLAAVPSRYPQIRAMVYFDAPDVTTGRGYELLPKTAGERELIALSQLPSYQPVRTGTTTAVTASTNAISPGQTVHLSAQVNGGDAGGHLTFYDNGSIVVGCGAVPLELSGSCDTTSLSAGDNQIVVDYSGDALSGVSVSPPVDVVVGSTPRNVGPPAIPGPGHVYLGAWVRPTTPHSALGKHAAVDEELSTLPSFNGGLARPLSIVHVYQSWENPASTRQVRQVLADGAIPMIDWYCGDTNANIVAGSDDALITAEAQRLAALKAPMFLRWYWEPNFPGSANYADCIGSLGPAGYAAAFRHIHDLFDAAGASNVAFVFSMATSGPDQDLYAYYPGSTYVDWIAADGYLRTSALPATGFIDRFSAWYSDFAGFGKPMMVSETAAFSGGQAGYLQQIEKQLSPGGAFPLIEAVMYFDAPGNGGSYTYPLDPSGFEEFAGLSASPMFQPARSESSVAATVSPTSPRAGQRVVLNAQVSNTDFGGSTSFFVNGTVLPGCQSLPVGTTSSCMTTGLPVGSNQIVAVYSGDAEVAGSTATVVSNVIAGSSPSSPSGSASSNVAFPPFQGVPDVGGVSALGFSGPSRLFAFPMTLSLPDFAAHAHTAGTSYLDPIAWGRAIVGRGGAATVLVPVGGVILFLLVAYMVSTWTQDRRRERRGKSALGSSMHAGTHPSDPSASSSKPEEAALRP